MPHLLPDGKPPVTMEQIRPLAQQPPQTLRPSRPDVPSLPPLLEKLHVPFVQYFHKGYALHGTYWHDEFGKLRSHGCVNLSPIDAAWLFEWTDPSVPPRWHGRVDKDRGTVVYIHV